MALVPELKTERLLLRPFDPADADNVYRLVSAPEVAETALNIPHPYPVDGAPAWISTHGPNAAAGAAFTWAVTDRVTGALYGAIELRVTPSHRRGEIGYWAGVPFWNRGITSEAAIRVVEHAFSMLDLQRVEATCLPRNRGSARVMEKAGLSYEGTLKGYVQKRGEPEDRAIYGIVRSDWQSARHRKIEKDPDG